MDWRAVNPKRIAVSCNSKFLWTFATFPVYWRSPNERISNLCLPLLSVYNSAPSIIEEGHRMKIPTNPPQPLLALTSDLKERSEERAKTNLFQMLSTLSGTIFFQESPALVALRDALGDAHTPLLLDGAENHKLLHNFLSHVPLTTYEDYQPFVTRFFDSKSPRLSDVNNLFFPGLPAFIANSSGTSGGHLKHFLIYPSPGYSGRRWDNFPDVPGFKMCSFSLINIDRWIKVVDGDDDTVQDIPVSNATTGGIRLYMGIGPMDDAEIIDKKGSQVKFVVGLHET